MVGRRLDLRRVFGACLLRLKKIISDMDQTRNRSNIRPLGFDSVLFFHMPIA